MKQEELYNSIISQIAKLVKKSINEAFGYNKDEENSEFNYDMDDSDLEHLDVNKINLNQNASGYKLLALKYKSQMESITKWGAKRGITNVGRLENIICNNHSDVRQFSYLAREYNMSMSELADAILNDNFGEQIVNDKKSRAISKYNDDVNDRNVRIKDAYAEAGRIIKKYRTKRILADDYLHLKRYKEELEAYLKDGHNSFVQKILDYINDLMSRKIKKAQYKDLGTENGWTDDNEDVKEYKNLLATWPKEYIVSGPCGSMGRCWNYSTTIFLDYKRPLQHDPVYVFRSDVDSSD